jgi:PleD family two-component response regulator
MSRRSTPLLSILLPVAAEPGSTAPEAGPIVDRPVRRVEPGAIRGTVLIAEDESVLRAIAERSLRNAGYRVILAESGERAVPLAAECDEPIDPLFTDIVMPGIHGIALAKSMRAARPGIRVPIAPER